MDNEVFRSTYQAINEIFCPYEKSILTDQCRCSQAERFCIAEREGVRCRSQQAQGQCLELLELLRRQARFTLKANDQQRALPHSQAMRIQVGGMRGIYRALSPEASPPRPIPDIFLAIESAKAQFSSLERLPFGEIVKEIAAFLGRPPRARRLP